MAHTTADQNAGKREVWRVTIILSVLTILELAIGFWMIGMEQSFFTTFLKGVIIILMLAKAFYIVAYFMHLGHELRNLIMTIVVPLGLFVWFIIAFLYDGASFKALKNTYDPGSKEAASQKATPDHQHKKDTHTIQPGTKTEETKIEH